jgi:D-alanyl-D-alanine carboxypeptidase
MKKQILFFCFTLLQVSFGQINTEIKLTQKALSLQNVLDDAVDQKKIFGTSFAIKQGDFKWTGASGNLKKDQSYFIASTTKLFTTAIILQLKSESQLSLDDKISQYLDKSTMNGLHIYKGTDYSDKITI